MNAEFQDVQTLNEYHNNGQLAYTVTVATLQPMFAHLFNDGRRIHPEGHSWIRIGKCAKYFDNGQLAWIINYDNKGVPVKDNALSFRKDGIHIQY